MQASEHLYDCNDTSQIYNDASKAPWFDPTVWEAACTDPADEVWGIDQLTML
jgi:hypothetical protein